MGQWGEAFGVPFAFEGLFFFTEAIFVSIYIFGWRRLKPWTHFWTGVPIAVAGIGGSISVVAANAWMNSPEGVTLELGRQGRDVDPMRVIFNDAMPLMAAHMVVAAYLVGGFLIASVYAVGMLRGRRDRYHRLGFLIPFTVAAIAIPVQMAVGDSLGPVGLQQPAGQVRRHRDGPPDQQRRPGDALRAPQLQRTRSSAGSPSPAWPRGCRIPTTGNLTVVQGLNTVPGRRPADHDRTSTSSIWPGTSWSASAPCCSC